MKYESEIAKLSSLIGRDLGKWAHMCKSGGNLTVRGFSRKKAFDVSKKGFELQKIFLFSNNRKKNWQPSFFQPIRRQQKNLGNFRNSLIDDRFVPWGKIGSFPQNCAYIDKILALQCLPFKTLAWRYLILFRLRRLPRSKSGWFEKKTIWKVVIDHKLTCITTWNSLLQHLFFAAELKQLPFNGTGWTDPLTRYYILGKL